jgi:1,4-dihydroxy-2-naphthoyl-CoA hydrolase
MIDVGSVQALLEPLFPGYLGVKLLEISPERVLAELEVRPQLGTTRGVLHGGAYMAFADTLGAIGTFLNMPPGHTTTTTDSSTKFMAGAKVGTTIRGESVPLHRGRTTMVWQTSITNERGKLCAVVSQTQLVLDAET